jgi:hypothetical protein
LHAQLTLIKIPHQLSLPHSRCIKRNSQALLALEDMLAGLDVRDDMAVLLDQALSPALTFLRNGSGSEKLDAATLLGSICEKRGGAAGFLVAEGALPAVTQLLTSGGRLGAVGPACMLACSTACLLAGFSIDAAADIRWAAWSCWPCMLACMRACLLACLLAC